MQRCLSHPVHSLAKLNWSFFCSAYFSKSLTNEVKGLFFTPDPLDIFTNFPSSCWKSDQFYQFPQNVSITPPVSAESLHHPTSFCIKSPQPHQFLQNVSTTPPGPEESLPNSSGSLRKSNQLHQFLQEVSTTTSVPAESLTNFTRSWKKSD